MKNRDKIDQASNLMLHFYWKSQPEGFRFRVNKGRSPSQHSVEFIRSDL
jgi:hypothetical protein